MLTAIPAEAQTPPRPPKPYAPVAITRPAVSDDASFVAFRAGLAAKAKARIYAELAPLVLAQGFFWGRDFGHAFDPRKPAVDNLAAAIALEQGNGAGWDTLAAFAAEATVEPLDSRPGIVCAPARPGYDGVAFSRLLDTTYTTGIDWAYPRAMKRRCTLRRGRMVPSRRARPAFRALDGVRGSRQRRRSWPQPMGARRPARRQARLCRSRQPDVASRRAALLR